MVCRRRGIATAQDSTATIEVRVQLSGAVPVPLPVHLGSITSSQSWSADIRSGEAVRFRLLQPGRYRLLAGGVERQLEVWAGDEVIVDVTGATAGRGNDVHVARTDRAQYGTQFNEAAIERLPDSGGLYGLIERSRPARRHRAHRGRRRLPGAAAPRRIRRIMDADLISSRGR